jgi:hypothetical protein
VISNGGGACELRQEAERWIASRLYARAGDKEGDIRAEKEQGLD